MSSLQFTESPSINWLFDHHRWAGCDCECQAFEHPSMVQEFGVAVNLCTLIPYTKFKLLLVLLSAPVSIWTWLPAFLTWLNLLLLTAKLLLHLYLLGCFDSLLIMFIVNIQYIVSLKLTSIVIMNLSITFPPFTIFLSYKDTLIWVTECLSATAAVPDIARSNFWVSILPVSWHTSPQGMCTHVQFYLI